MTSLYTLTGQYKELAALQQGADEDMQVAVRDTLGAIEGEFNEKAKAISSLILNMDSDAAAIDAEIERLKERKRIMTNRQSEIREYLRDNMEAAGITKISCPLFTITLAQGRESVVITDESLLPDEMTDVKTDIKPNKKAITDAIKAGQDVPGAHLERGQSSVRIK